MKILWKTIKETIRNFIARTWRSIKPYLKWKMLPIALSIWLITNGIWYVFAVAPFTPIWLRGIAIGWLAILYMPFTPEKIIIVVLAPIIYRWIYKEEFKKEKVIK